jgi:hypothetical protein
MLALSTLLVNICAAFAFGFFLPTGIRQCKDLQTQRQVGNNVIRGYAMIAFATIMLTYTLTVAVLLLNPSTSCLAFVGGGGCS